MTTKRSRRNEALRLYLERLGEISFNEIASIVGCNRSTVGRWAKSDEWDRQLAEIKGEASRKITESVSDDISGMFEADLAQARRIGEIIESRLAGPAKSLAVSEIRALVDALEKKVKICRLLADQSTSNSAVLVSDRSPASESDSSGQGTTNFERRMQEIARTGDAESQRKLYEIARLWGELNAPFNE